jgi:cytochrome c-type biogenesis protein CcmH
MRALLFVVVLALASPALAQDAPASADRAVANAEAQTIFREVMSPFCPGLTLADCPSPNAFTLRGEIEARLAKGESRDAILDELVTKYGTQILADPSDTPIGSVVWGVPFALSALAAAGLALFLRRATRTHTEEANLAVAGPPGISERLDEELAELD